MKKKKKKRVEDLNRHFSKEDIQKSSKHIKKMLNIVHYQRNANQNYNVISLHTHQNGHYQKKTTNNKCWRKCGEKATLLHSCWECKLVLSLQRTIWRFLNKLGIKLLYDPAIPLLDIHPKKTIIQKHTIPVFIAALFIMSRK